MNTRFLTILTTLAFLGFSVSAFAGKYGTPYPTFDVEFSGELLGYGTLWQSGQKQEGLTYWASDHPEGSVGFIDLTYFEDYFSVLPSNTLCFQGNPPTPINGLQFFRDRDDAAVLKISFEGSDRSGTLRFMYLLTLEGDFDENVSWLPKNAEVHPVVLSNWDLKLKKKRENNLYSEDSCVGSGSFLDATIRVCETGDGCF
jgi:hypothetical protein